MSAAVLADRLLAARAAAARLPLLTQTEPDFTLATAYEVADLIRQRRIAAGERPRGYKIGFTNRDIWQRYGVHAPIWAPVWDSTLSFVDGPDARVSLRGLVQPRLEPEIVFGFARSPRAGMNDAELTACIEWVAHGFEIVQTHFDDWKFEAADTVADFALHGRLLVGPRVPVAAFDPLGSELAGLRLELYRDGRCVDSGLGSVVLDGPLNALRLWVDALLVQPHGWPIVAGDVVTTGTLTDAWPLGVGDRFETRLGDPRLTGLRLLVEA